MEQKIKDFITVSTSILEHFMARVGYLALGAVIGLLEIDALYQSFTPESTVEIVFILFVGICLALGLESFGIEGTRKASTFDELRQVKSQYIRATLTILATILVAPALLASSSALAESDASTMLNIFGQSFLATLSTTIVPVVGAGVASLVGINYYASQWNQTEATLRQSELEIALITRDTKVNGLARIKKVRDAETRGQVAGKVTQPTQHDVAKSNIGFQITQPAPDEMKILALQGCNLSEREQLALRLDATNVATEVAALQYGATRQAYSATLRRAKSKIKLSLKSKQH